MTTLWSERDRERYTFRQRWASYLTIIVALGGLMLGVLYRDRTMSAVYPFINRQLGITALYPAEWLLEEGSDSFVLRAQDPRSLPFKTTIELRLLPVGAGARPSDVLNLLDLDRAGRLPAYRSLSREALNLPGGQRGTRMDYAYALAETNPFLRAAPITIRGTDIVVLRPGQAVVISFRSDAAFYDTNRRYFDAFLRSLVY